MSEINNYTCKPSITHRSGTYERQVFYSIPSTTRDFDYQNPRKFNQQLTGRCSRHIVPKESGEKTFFTTRRNFNLPDSKRTLNPSIAPSTKHTGRSNSQTCLKFNEESKDFNYIANTFNQCKRRPTNPKCYQSFKLSTDIEPDTDTPRKRMLKPAYYKKYDYTTQISFLPGAKKRNGNEINDNYFNNSYVNNNCKTTYESHKTKEKRDYNTNIACLPGGILNNEEEKKNLVMIQPKKYIDNNIFNVDYNQINNPYENSFNISHKKHYEVKKKLYADSGSHFDYNQPQGGIRRGYKNTSQISLV